MVQPQEAHPTHNQNEYIVAAVAGTGLFLGIAVAILDAFGTREDILGLGLTSVLYIAIGLVVIGAALWLALLRPWEKFDDLQTPFYTGHDHHTEGDELHIIEGIGPKAQEALHSAGITTFAQLAGSSVDSLKAALEKAGLNLRLMKPDTWPKQARLVADGDTEGFEALKHELRAGVDVIPDDLTIIEGIGPKAQEALNAAGISSYAQLATASVDDLRVALDAAGSRMRILKPDSWPKQAQFVVDGDTTGFEAYKAKLVGGVDPDA
jgi:predicted flap endonuclease-1-like 5' DNA nuclease